MKKTVNFKLALLALAIPNVLSSCTKKDTVDTLSVATPAQDVKVLSNGRLAFADNKAFDQAFTNASSMSALQLDKWENRLNFHSLRAATTAESAKLLQGFGFPGQYAALISEAGEYQIGNRISWFHDGFRYVAQSEQELQAIKADPTIAKEKFSAGVQKTSSDTPSGQEAAREVRDSDYQVGDGRYNGRLETVGPGSQRKLSFESILYVEDASDRHYHDPGGRVWYSSISINEYYEYYSSSANTYYRCDDYPRTTSYNLTASADINGSGFGAQHVENSLYLNGYQHSGINDYRTTVLEAYVQSSLRPGKMVWTYFIQGHYVVNMNAATAAGASPNYGNVYNDQSSNQLW